VIKTNSTLIQSKESGGTMLDSTQFNKVGVGPPHWVKIRMRTNQSLEIVSGNNVKLDLMLPAISRLIAIQGEEEDW